MTIAGSRLLGGDAGAESVKLAGIAAAIDDASATEITVVARTPSSLGSGDVMITADTGAVVGTSWQAR